MDIQKINSLLNEYETASHYDGFNRPLKDLQDWAPRIARKAIELNQSLNDLGLDRDVKLLAAHCKIDEQGAEIAQLREAQRWIPVSERLPEDGVRVLVLDTNSELNVCSRSYWQNGLYLWDYAYFDRFHADKKVTHWMPLLEVPVGQNVSAEEAFGGAL